MAPAFVLVSDTLLLSHEENASKELLNPVILSLWLSKALPCAEMRIVESFPRIHLFADRH